MGSTGRLSIPTLRVRLPVREERRDERQHQEYCLLGDDDFRAGELPVIGGVIGLMNGPEVVTSTQHLGYPASSRSSWASGNSPVALVVAAPGLPPLKESASAGFVFDLTAASISHAAVGDRRRRHYRLRIVFLALVLASSSLRPVRRGSYRLRPASIAHRTRACRLMAGRPSCVAACSRWVLRLPSSSCAFSLAYGLEWPRHRPRIRSMYLRATGRQPQADAMHVGLPLAASNHGRNRRYAALVGFAIGARTSAAVEQKQLRSGAVRLET